MDDRETPVEVKRPDTFVLDFAFIKREMREAVKLYFAPFAGVYRAFKDPVS